MKSDGVLTAFEIIIDELREVSDEIKAEVKAVLDTKGFVEAEALIDTGKLLDAFSEKVDVLREEWLSSFDAKTRERTHVAVEDISKDAAPASGGQAEEKLTIVELRIKDAIARATLSGIRKLILLPGSTVCKKELPSLRKSDRQRRASCVKDGELVDMAGKDLYEVVSPVTFRSPSAAARFVSASSINGLESWVVEGMNVSLGTWKSINSES